MSQAVRLHRVHAIHEDLWHNLRDRVREAVGLPKIAWPEVLFLRNFVSLDPVPSCTLRDTAWGGKEWTYCTYGQPEDMLKGCLDWSITKTKEQQVALYTMRGRRDQYHHGMFPDKRRCDAASALLGMEPPASEWKKVEELLITKKLGISPSQVPQIVEYFSTHPCPFDERFYVLVEYSNQIWVAMFKWRPRLYAKGHWFCLTKFEPYIDNKGRISPLGSAHGKITDGLICGNSLVEDLRMTIFLDHAFPFSPATDSFRRGFLFRTRIISNKRVRTRSLINMDLI